MSVLLSFAGWTFVPNFASGFIHNGLQRVLAGRIASPGTLGYVRDRKIIHVVVVLSYLVYTLVTAYMAIEPNFYHLLSVPVNVDDKQLRKAFKRISAQHHPDKGGDERIFRALRAAYDTLADPASRFAYDRFGPQVMEWPKMTMLHDYMLRGFKSQAVFYIQSTLFIFILGYFQNSHAMYWRVLTFLFLACINFVIITRAEILPIFKYTLSSLIQYQQTSLLQSACITILVAIAQSAPILFPPAQDPADALMETAAIANLCHAEATQTVQMAHLPFARGTLKAEELYAKTADWMVEARIDQDPEVVAVKQDLLRRVPR